jgi:hypothetical protein
MIESAGRIFLSGNVAHQCESEDGCKEEGDIVEEARLRSRG